MMCASLIGPGLYIYHMTLHAMSGMPCHVKHATSGCVCHVLPCHCMWQQVKASFVKHGLMWPWLDKDMLSVGLASIPRVSGVVGTWLGKYMCSIGLA